MLFCERAFGVWFLLWGMLLLVDAVTPIARRGIFFGHLEAYLPGWGWGVIFILVAVARWLAYRAQSRRWRVGLSATTFVLLVIVSSIAAAARLYGATLPLAGFAAYVAWWCHRAILRDSRLGL